MSKANADIKYDPELPFAVMWQPGSVWARFHMEDDARDYVTREGGLFVDTTPKPKIPEDAQHITRGTETLAFSRYIDDLWYGWNYGHGLSDEELLEMIGNSEVTVLVRKEET